MNSNGGVRFAILGRFVDASMVPDIVGRWLRQHWHFPNHAIPSHPFRIRLAILHPDDSPPPPAHALPCEAGVPGYPLSCARSGASWWIGDGAEGVRLELTDEESRIDFWYAEPAPSPTGFAALMVALAESVRASGLIPLHAAIAVRDGEAMALLARSGTGKSTTLLRAVDAGWSPLAEDFAWLDPASLIVYGWDHGVHLWPETLERHLPHLAAMEWAVDSAGKLFLPFDRLPTESVGSAPLSRIVLLDRTAQEGDPWEEVHGADAVRALWEACGVPLSPISRARTALRIAELLRGTTVLRLRLGAAPLELSPPPLAREDRHASLGG